MRGGRALTLLRTTSFNHDHRLVARRSARRRHELARRFDRLDVQQDGARSWVAGQVVQHVAEVHVGVLAQRDEVREADGSGARPVEHRGHQRARLRNEGQLAGRGIGVREAGIQADVRRQQADAVGAQDAQQVRAGGVQHGFLLRRVQPGSQYHRGARSECAQLADQARHRRWRRADHGQLGNGRQVSGACKDRLPVELVAL